MTAQVCADAVVACRADRAMARLVTIHDVTVGPRRRILLHKRIRTRIGSPTRHRWTTVSSMRWTPTGRLARLFPTLHAGLAVTAIDDTTCLLSVVGEYVPPFGRVGVAADRAGLHRVADSTVREFTTRLARTLAQESGEVLL